MAAYARASKHALSTALRSTASSTGAARRAYAVPSFAPSSASPFSVFDRTLKVAQRDRAARNKDRSRLTDYVKDDVAETMVDRLLVRDLTPSLTPRDRLYTRCILTSCSAGHQTAIPARARRRIRTGLPRQARRSRHHPEDDPRRFVASVPSLPPGDLLHLLLPETHSANSILQAECCIGMRTSRPKVRHFRLKGTLPSRVHCADIWYNRCAVPLERIHLDEEALSSHFEENSHECIMSCLALHWVNDLPGKQPEAFFLSREFLLSHLTAACKHARPMLTRWVTRIGTLIQIRRTLKPDGVFIGSMFGGDTLFELR